MRISSVCIDLPENQLCFMKASSLATIEARGVTDMKALRMVLFLLVLLIFLNACSTPTRTYLSLYLIQTASWVRSSSPIKGDRRPSLGPDMPRRLRMRTLLPQRLSPWRKAKSQNFRSCIGSAAGTTRSVHFVFWHRHY